MTTTELAIDGQPIVTYKLYSTEPMLRYELVIKDGLGGYRTVIRTADQIADANGEFSDYGRGRCGMAPALTCIAVIVSVAAITIALGFLFAHRVGVL